MTVWAILAASLIGSPHCAAMCGLVAGTAGGGAVPVICYHGARLLGYLMLGLVAGSAGAGIDRLAGAFQIAGGATRVAGAVLVLMGAATLLAASGARPLGFAVPGRWIGETAGRVRGWRPSTRAVALGGLTALFPCGWLFAFLAAAVGTGGPIPAAVAMAVFWLGTVPALVGASLVVHRLAGRFRRRLPLVGAVALIVLGLVTALGRPILHR